MIERERVAQALGLTCGTDTNIFDKIIALLEKAYNQGVTDERIKQELDGVITDYDFCYRFAIDTDPAYHI